MLVGAKTRTGIEGVRITRTEMPTVYYSIRRKELEIDRTKEHRNYESTRTDSQTATKGSYQLVPYFGLFQVVDQPCLES